MSLGRWTALAARIASDPCVPDGAGGDADSTDISRETVGTVGAPCGGIRTITSVDVEATPVEDTRMQPPPALGSRWTARAAGYEVLGGLSAREADERVSIEMAAPGADAEAPPWVWFVGDGGPFRVVGDVPPTAEHPSLVAKLLVCIRDLNDAWPEDDAASQRAAERAEAVLEALRHVGVRVWLAS